MKIFPNNCVICCRVLLSYAPWEFTCWYGIYYNLLATPNNEVNYYEILQILCQHVYQHKSQVIKTLQGAYLTVSNNIY